MPTPKKKPVKKTAARPALSALEQRFAQEYVKSTNGTRAYLACKPHVAEKSACVLATRLLSKVSVRAEVDRLMAKVEARTEISAAQVIRTAWDMMTADAREFAELHVGCCRHCWGKAHRFQHTDGELSDAEAQHKARKLLADAKQRKAIGDFDPQGGGGFDAKREPNPDCPTCAGAGNPRAVFKDTRKLSAGAAQLFAGIKETDKGLEVKTHSKDAAVDKLMRHFGLYRDKIELTMPTVLVRDLTGRKPPAP